MSGIKSQTWHPARFLFVAFLLIASLLLLSQIGEQVRYAGGKPFYKQPGLWTAIGLFGMTITSIVYAFRLWSGRPRGAIEYLELREELLFWVKSLEYLLWFMVYVFSVPYIGYLPASILFAVLLTLRLGYYRKPMILSALLTAVSVVVLFKSLLQVKIPGGGAYEYLPESLRNFFIINF